MESSLRLKTEPTNSNMKWMDFSYNPITKVGLQQWKLFLGEYTKKGLSNAYFYGSDDALVQEIHALMQDRNKVPE